MNTLQEAVQTHSLEEILNGFSLSSSSVPSLELELQPILKKICFPVRLVSNEELFGKSSDPFLANLKMPLGVNQYVISDNFGEDSNENRILGIHGQEYSLTDNESILRPIVNALDSSIGRKGYSIKVQNFSNQNFKIVFKIKGIQKSLANVKDILSVNIIVRNSYDGSYRKSVSVGIERLVCKNGLTAFEIFHNKSKKHIGSNYDFINSLNGIETSILAVLDKVKHFQKMSEVEVTTKDMDEVMLILNKKHNIPLYVIENAKGIVESEREKLGYASNNVWLTYNAINNIIDKELNSSTYNPSFKDNLDRKCCQEILNFFNLNSEIKITQLN